MRNRSRRRRRNANFTENHWIGRRRCQPSGREWHRGWHDLCKFTTEKAANRYESEESGPARPREYTADVLKGFPNASRSLHFYSCCQRDGLGCVVQSMAAVWRRLGRSRGVWRTRKRWGAAMGGLRTLTARHIGRGRRRALADGGVSTQKYDALTPQLTLDWSVSNLPAPLFDWYPPPLCV